ncbi:preprotein translocase subunit SecA [bacterium]|nr:preprotein translocase subunit SecA [bacterium]
MANVLDLVKGIVGNKNERELRKLRPVIDRVNGYESEYQLLTDMAMVARTAEFKGRVANGESLDEILPEAFALVREAGRRFLALRHYDVQLIGGCILHQGKIAEMKTGEGKTLVATLAAYLNALTGKGVHIVTVNDYLARRDRDWMGGIYHSLGLTTGVIQHDVSDQDRKRAYEADITYCTNNELGFDYLRDNMKYRQADFVQREHVFAIVDEVDSILIDEARTPLIISGPTEESTDKYYQINRLVPRLRRGQDFDVDEKSRSVSLTESGIEKAEEFLHVENLYESRHMELVHHINQALKAHILFKRDVDYVVKDGEVLIVDEFTGRLMPGRRYSEGLHQALEAKEGLSIANENQTLATITFQNYFRMYTKLAGMTGTADTEAAEFNHIYKLDVVVIPTNRELIRYNSPDIIYKSKREKFNAVIEEIKKYNDRGQPVLVGTISIEDSEVLARMLKRHKINHNVLNAKYHEQEAAIISQAGRLGAVTISTNMAGRGTDILLGGNPDTLFQSMLEKRNIAPDNVSVDLLERLKKESRETTAQEHEAVVALGGLHIIGTERHESRRIDNQLRGRAGRQGDPGSSRFYLSLEDDLMRIFGSERIASIMDRLGVEENQPIESRLITRQIESAQKRVEAHHFDIRKHVLQYDDVMNKQREVIYEQRRAILDGDDLSEAFYDMIAEVVESVVTMYTAENTYSEEWDWESLQKNLQAIFNEVFVFDEETRNSSTQADLQEVIQTRALERYHQKEKQIGEEVIRFHEKNVLLYVIDSLWKDHLLAIDHLKEGIGFRAYGQKDPLIEFKREAFDLFTDLVERIKEDSVKFMYLLQPTVQDEIVPRRRSSVMVESRGQGDEQKKTTPVKKESKVGRNEPCPCGSGKKYKKCCGK